MDSNKKFIIEELEEADKELCEFVNRLGVSQNTKQKLKWFIMAEDEKAAYSFRDNCLQKTLPKLKCFSGFSIIIGKGFCRRCPILIETYDFLFNPQNVLKFYKALLELAKKNNMDFDYRQIEIDRKR